MGKKEFEKIYEEYNESLETAPESVRNAYQAMHSAFEECLCAIEEWTFRTSFEFGQNYGSKSDIRKAV